MLAIKGDRDHYSYVDIDDYFDLTVPENDIDALTINASDHFECVLQNFTTNQVYKGFVLARSPQGNRLTVCDLGFHRSATDGKYQPRITFRRTNQELLNASASASARQVIMPFSSGNDGYREFWKVIFFLYKFKESIDFGDFDGQYHMLSADQLTEYLNTNSNHQKILDAAKELNTDVSGLLRTSSTIKLLNEYKDKLEEFITNESTETDVQNWIDEDNHRYRQQRCLIFGLEYINFKREGSVSSKRFDVLTRVGSKYIDHVLIELKSPCDDIFDISTSATVNDNTSEYKIHKELARAIPQILEYKSTLESKPGGDPELEKLGIYEKPHIGKCIIVIGKHRNDLRWKQNRENLVRSLNSNLEVWTYTELLNKLKSTIENLERVGDEIDPDEPQF